MKKIPSLTEQLKRTAKDAKAYKAGKTRFKTTLVEKDGARTTWYESGPEERARRERFTRFKSIRADLGLSQSEMAAALHVSTNTLKGWEAGKPIPDVVFVLVELLHDVPAVRKRLITA